MNNMLRTIIDAVLMFGAGLCAGIAIAACDGPVEPLPPTCRAAASLTGASSAKPTHDDAPAMCALVDPVVDQQCACDATPAAVALVSRAFEARGYPAVEGLLRVRWHGGQCVAVLDGFGGPASEPGAPYATGSPHFCVFGQESDCTIYVAYQRGLGAVFSHEVAHCAMQLRYGDGDPLHSRRDEWAWAEAVGANALADAGLR